jgi:type II secretory pathway component PulF
MSGIESWFPTVTRSSERYYRWRMIPWWPSEGRACRERSLLRLIALAHAQRLDLVPLLRHFADEQFGSYRRRVARLACRVADGTPIVEAIEQTPEVLDDDAVLAIRFGAQTGTLSSVYRDLIAARDPSADLPQMRLQNTLIYGLVSLLAIGFALAFLFIFVFPTLRQIHEEYALDNAGPLAFNLLLGLGQHVWSNAAVYLLLVLLMVWLLWAPPVRKWFRRTVLSRWVGGVSQSRSAEILQLLSVSSEAGRPVASALSTLAHYHFDPQVRQQLLLARNQIEQGVCEWVSLGDVGLLTESESRALADSSSERSRVWTMRRLANWKRGRALNQRDRASSFALPGLTLAMAAIVLLISTAMFSFLAYLIWSLTYIQ